MNLFEMARGQTRTVWLSEYFDEDDDRVYLRAEMTDQMREWIDFDVDYRRFEIRPNAETPLGPTIVKIILDDTKD